jgi:predicted ATP-dependent endonuclease of OLD family
MYISSVKITGFRNFNDSTIDFQEGVNVIIGHNNAGKTNLLKSLSLILDTSSSKKLEVDDFNKFVELDDLKMEPPKVQISLTISESNDEDLAGDDLVTVANWLTKLESPYEAQLTYEFFLPQGEWESYKEALKPVNNKREAWSIIKHEFLRKFTHKIYGGNPLLKVTADNDSIYKFDYQFLDAIRDVERDMFTGRNTLLRDVVDFFIDYEIKNNSKTSNEKLEEIKAQKKLFSENANVLMEMLQERMKEGEGHILKYAHDTGASFNEAEPGFDGNISEVELYSTLRLIIKYSTGIEIPATHNGLGYNNLIFMSLLLAKMQVDTNGDYLGSNAKVFPILVIEEPEAHLHPSMQYKFLKFLKENVKNKARQVFITSHSTHITSAVSLDEIICMSVHDEKLNVGYPGKVFTNDEEGKKSKAFVQRFLDATRSDMLFAKSVLLVEGMAEQLLMPTFARYHNNSLEDAHVAVINIGGRYFDHFIKLFDVTNPHAVHKKISCVTDRDPEHKKPGDKQKFKYCYPFETNLDSTFSYQEKASENITLYSTHPTIRFFSQDSLKGKTLEYDLFYHNPTCKLLLTDSIKNKEELEKLIDAIAVDEDLATIDGKKILRESDENKRIMNALNKKPVGWTQLALTHSLVAARYLNSVGKGENALELAVTLEENLNKETPVPFVVPSYITEAIDWVCQ